MATSVLTNTSFEDLYKQAQAIAWKQMPPGEKDESSRELWPKLISDEGSMFRWRYPERCLFSDALGYVQRLKAAGDLKGAVSPEKLLEKLRELIFNSYNDAKTSFMIVELLHLCKGEEYMRELFSDHYMNIFFSLGPSLYYKKYYTLFTSYFIEIGLAREMYLSCDRRGIYPLHYLCSTECDEKVAKKKLKLVPLDVMSEALTLTDDLGNTMIHSAAKTKVLVEDRSPFFRASYLERLEIISKAEGYEKTLLVLNKKGRTPLHEVVLNCTCPDTILFLLETPSGKKAASIKDKHGKTPHDLFLEVQLSYREKNVKAAEFMLNALKE